MHRVHSGLKFLFDDNTLIIVPMEEQHERVRTARRPRTPTKSCTDATPDLTPPSHARAGLRWRRRRCSRDHGVCPICQDQIDETTPRKQLVCGHFICTRSAATCWRGMTGHTGTWQSGRRRFRRGYKLSCPVCKQVSMVDGPDGTEITIL